MNGTPTTVVDGTSAWRPPERTNRVTSEHQKDTPPFGGVSLPVETEPWLRLNQRIEDFASPNQTAIDAGRIDRTFLNTMAPRAMTVPTSTIIPTGIVAYDVVTVAQSMHTAAESNVSWLAELQIEQHEFIGNSWLKVSLLIP